jgi:hypothetical protein
MTIECKFCKNTFSSSSSLKTHQSSAKYCIKIQGVEMIKKYNCEYCSKEYTQRIDLNRHIINCKVKNIQEKEETKNTLITAHNKIIEEKNKTIQELTLRYETRIKELQDQLIDIIKTRPMIVNQNNHQNNNQKINTFINNMQPITDDHLIEQSQYLTIEHIKQGADGYAQYALEYPFKERIICVDYSRRKIKYKDQENNIIEDPEMIKLSQKFFQAIEDSNSKLINNHLMTLKEQLDEMNNSPNNYMNEKETEEFELQSDSILNSSFDMIRHRKEVKEAAKGNKPEIYFDFIKNICAKVTK